MRHLSGTAPFARKSVGNDDRTATPEEMSEMRRLVEQGMRQGAFGLSSGLFYVPGAFAPTEEVVELAQVAARHGGMYISHMRNEADGLLESVAETIRIGEEGGLPTQLTHHKAVGPPNWGEDRRIPQDGRRGRGREGLTRRSISIPTRPRTPVPRHFSLNGRRPAGVPNCWSGWMTRRRGSA